jgi:uncharacterized protein (TIGR02246 family)
MNPQSDESEQNSSASQEALVLALYQRLLDSWNRRDAEAFASQFETEAQVVGFDGSSMNGRAEIELSTRQIFTDHITAAYIGKVRGVRFLTPEVAILRAIVGMVPPGQTDINPAVNAIQVLVATGEADGRWRIALFQNTPAQFHGRPEVSEALTQELRQLLKNA